MSEQDGLLSDSEREAIEQIAARGEADGDGRRARALLAVADGESHSVAADSSNLTSGQLEYFLRKFREQRLDAFTALDEQPAGQLSDSTEEQAIELRRLIDELNVTLRELQALIPTAKQASTADNYSPVGLLIMVRDNVGRLTPDMQLDVLRSFQGMSAEDLMDIETWKGMAYMMTYSARFQAGQMRDTVSNTINRVVPEPIQPGRLWRWAKSGVDRFTPEFAKQIVGTFQDATVSDLKDPDTWKGVWYMLSYSLQFQAEQMRDRLVQAEAKQQAE